MSEKSMVPCPFVIHYTYINFEQYHKHQRFVLDVRVTFVNLEYTFQLNITSFSERLKLSGSCMELHREGIGVSLELLRNNPACDAIHLHRYLEKELPNWCSISASHIANFGQFANRYWLKNHYDTFVTITAQTIRYITGNIFKEVIDLDDPIIHINYQKLLGNTMK